MLTLDTLTEPAYQTILAASERITWRVEDLIGGPRQLDFSRPFMPAALAGVDELPFLSARERVVLNQLRGHAYLHVFALVEEFILPFLFDQLRPDLHGDSARTRAYVDFASEEAKHIDLFRRFRDAFLAGFGAGVEVIGPPDEIARAVLARPPLAVAMLILMIEWMTQRHWIEAARDDGTLEPLFKDLLRHHWMEEAQHAKLDELLVERLAEACTPAEIVLAVDQMLEIGLMFDGALAHQVELDLNAFEAATGRVLGAGERAQARDAQVAAVRWTFLGSGLSHPRFVAALERLTPDASARVAAAAPAFIRPTDR